MIKIQVKTNGFTVRNWNDKITGKPMSMRIQILYVYLPDSTGKCDDYDKVEFILNDKSNPFEVGDYKLVPQCLYLDRNNRMQISYSNMQPMNQTQKAA